MTRPVTVPGGRGTNPVYSSVKNRNNRPSQEEGERENDRPPEEGTPDFPLFELVDEDTAGHMMVLFPGDGERRLRFLKKQMRSERGVTARLPVGRVLPESVSEVSPYTKRYRASETFHRSNREESFRNRM